MLRLMSSLYFEKHILPLILPNREFAYMLDYLCCFVMLKIFPLLMQISGILQYY